MMIRNRYRATQGPPEIFSWFIVCVCVCTKSLSDCVVSSSGLLLSHSKKKNIVASPFKVSRGVSNTATLYSTRNTG